MSSTNVSLDSLLQHCGLEKAALCKEVTAKHLEIISRILTGEMWRKLAPHLELDGNVVDNIEHDYKKEEMKKHAFLCKWSRLKNGEATYQRLVKGILMFDARAAKRVCMLLLNDVSMTIKM